MVAPLGALPFAELSAWDQAGVTFDGFWDALSFYVPYLLFLACVSGAPAGLIVWGLMAWSGAPVRAWVIIPAFTAVYSPPFLFLSDWGAMVFLAVTVGLPVSVTYCLAARAPLWRGRPASVS